MHTIKCNLLLVIFALRIVYISSESLDSAIFDISTLEFAKDIATLVVESTLKSRCDGNIFVVSQFCEQYLDHALASIRDWAPPLLVVKFENYETIPKDKKDSWIKYLSWHKKSCSLIFICDLIASPSTIGDNNNGSLLLDDDYNADFIKDEGDDGYLEFPRFMTNLDQILYVSERQLAPDGIYSKQECDNDRTTLTELKLMKKSGAILSIRAQRSLDNPESVMQVCSKCEFCMSDNAQHYTLLGDWQRNKTHFGKYLDIYDSFRKQSFNNFHFRVGYFNYFPHFACLDKQEQLTSTLFFPHQCMGVEWEIIKNLGKSLEFSFSLTNIGNSMQKDTEADDSQIQTTNFTPMINSFQMGVIDIAVGGITVTSERMAVVDFSQVFETEPIVFVVQKPKNIFFLGIWLAFQPHVWPIIILLVAIMSFLFQSITNDGPPSSCCLKQHQRKLSLSIIIRDAIEKSKRKPLIVRIFDALQLTLQPMLGQPLNPSQICQPRRFKMLLVLWWFSCLIITTLYSTSLISSLINPVITKEPESVQELIDAGYYFKFGGRHAAVQELINATSSPLDQPTDDDAGFEAHHNEDINKVTKLLNAIRALLLPPGEIANPNTVAFIVEESGIGNDNNPQLTNMLVMKERLFITGYSFALKPNAHFKRKLDIGMSHLNAGGLISHWSSMFVDKGGRVPERKFRLRQRLGQINLNLKILQGAFIFLVFGLSFSTLVFCLEHWNRRYVFRVYNARQLLSIARMTVTYMKRFYYDHVDDPKGSNNNKNERKQHKFRNVVDTVVKLRQAQNQAYLK